MQFAIECSVWARDFDHDLLVKPKQTFSTDVLGFLFTEIQQVRTLFSSICLVRAQQASDRYNPITASVFSVSKKEKVCTNQFSSAPQQLLLAPFEVWSYLHNGNEASFDSLHQLSYIESIVVWALIADKIELGSFEASSQSSVSSLTDLPLKWWHLCHFLLTRSQY